MFQHVYELSYHKLDITSQLNDVVVYEFLELVDYLMENLNRLIIRIYFNEKKVLYFE